jgi:hypothetical protein
MIFSPYFSGKNSRTPKDRQTDDHIFFLEKCSKKSSENIFWSHNFTALGMKLILQKREAFGFVLFVSVVKKFFFVNVDVRNLKYSH